MPKIPVGQDLYLFSPSGSSSNHCIISAHGDFMPGLRGKEFTAPNDVLLAFYVDHGEALIDPGLENFQKMASGEYRPTQLLGKGKPCPNYHLSKYQEQHNGRVMPVIEKIFGCRGESYDQIEKQFDTDAARVKRAPGDYQQAKVNRSQLETDPQFQKLIPAMKKSIVEAQDDDLVKKRKAAEFAARAVPYHVATIRNRCNTHVIRLSDVVTQIRQATYNQVNVFHCCFCRVDWDGFRRDRSAPAQPQRD